MVQNLICFKRGIKKSTKKFFFRLSLLNLLLILLFFSASINIYDNNSENKQNHEINEENFLKTSAAPVISINSPINYTLYGNPTPSYSITIIEGLGNYTWYEFIETGDISEPIALNGEPNEIVTDKFDNTFWHNQEDGIVTIRFYVNNSLGEIGYSDAVIRLDTTLPDIEIISPTTGFFNSSPPDFTIEISEANLNQTWYTLNVNITKHFFQENGSIDYSAWNFEADGAIDITFFANDSVGNEDSKLVQVTKDVIAPIAPIGLNAVPSSWTNINSYDLSWSNPSDTSGIIGAYYKLGTVPLSDTDGTYEQGNDIESISDIIVESDGINNVYVWLKDGAGNINFSNYETTLLYLDTNIPIIIDSQAGDDTWRNVAGTTYDVDFSDPDPSSNLSYAQYKITTAPDQGGTILKDWTDIFTGLGATSYTINWTIDFAACQEGINYVSVRVYDDTGNMAIKNDTFYVKKDTTSPTITDSQAGDDIWLNAAGTTYDVDFSDPDPSSNLSYAQYKITTTPDQGGTILKDWTDIFTGLGATSYTINWTIDFAACQEGINYISVRVYDEAGNMASENDTFYVEKDTISPTIIDSQAGDDTWRNTASTTYDVDFSDPDPSSNLSYAQYKITTTPDQGGTILKDWTNIFSNLGASSYTTNWTIDFAACQEGMNYISVRVYDEAGNMASENDTFYLKKDTISPTITDSQAGDDIWRNAAGTTYDVDFSDPDPSSNLSYAQYKITTAPNQGGTILKDWTDIFTGLGATSYTNNWTIDFTVCQEGTNYISVRVYDEAGNMASANDTFYIKKDTISPTITDSQAGDDIWRNAAGTTYDVDFSDPDPSSNLSYAQYKITTAPDQGGTILKDWTDIFTGLGATSYTNNWTIDFAACQEGMNYISVRVYDEAGNMASENDTFYVKKDTISPTITDSQAGDDTWRNTAGTTYDVDFSDPDPSSNLSYAQYKITTAPDQGGTILKDWTDIFTGLGATSYTINWTIDFDACQEGMNYISVRVYDEAGNMASENDTFYIKKDTISPTITDSQAGDDIWRNAAGTTYDVDFSDPDPSSNLSYAQYKITTAPNQGGTILKDWTDIFSNLGASSYTTNWTIDFNACQEGTNYISVRVYDEAGNMVSENDTFYVKKDTIAPTLIINSPIDGLECKIAPNIQVTATDPNLESVWYSVGGTQIMLTNGVSEPLNSSIWDSLSNEDYFTINFYANDSMGNINNTFSFTLYKDALAPRLLVNLPINNTYYANPPPINITVFDSSLKLFYYMVGTTQIPLTNNTEVNLDSGIWNSLGQGEFIIYLSAWDNLNNLNDTYSLKLYKDTLAPEITINSPENSTHFNSRPIINITAIDPKLDTLWYRVGTINITLNSGIEELLNDSIWNSLEEGPFNIEIFANDTFGHFNNSYLLTLYKDTITPFLIINLPINETIHNSRPLINVTVFDAYLDTLWYTVGTTNITLNNNSEVLFDLYLWNNLPDEGAIIIYFYANDSAGNLNNTFIFTLYKDIKAPTILINSPQPNDLFGENPPSVFLDVQDANLDEIWYQLNDGTIETDNYSWTGFINQTVWDQVGDGTVMIKFYANDTFNHLGYAEVSVRKNTEKPIITIETPQDNDLFGIIAPNFTIYTSGIALNTTWYTLDDGQTNFTFTGLDGTINQEAWASFGFGTITIRFYINDSLGVIGFDEVTINKDPDPPLITIDSPDDGKYYRDPPNIQVLATDANLDSVWYSVGGILIMLTNGVSEPLDSSIWNSLSEGQFLLRIYANDTLGYINDTLILTLYKDTLAPFLVINTPTNQTYYNVRPPINITAYDPNLTNMYYMVGTTQIALTNNTEVLLDIGIWNSLTQGEFNIYLYAWDSLNHQNNTYVITLYKDTLPPEIIINTPSDNSYWNSPPPINVSAIDPNLDTIWYRAGSTNITLNSGIEELLDTSIWSSLGEGTFNIEIYANDTFGYINNSFIITLYKDLTPPTIKISSPSNNTYYNIAPNMLLIVTDASIDSLWYIVNNSKIFLSNGILKQFDPDIWDNLPQGAFQIFIFANDTAGNLNNTLIITLLKDTLAPLIQVNLPYNNTYCNARPTINVEAFDPNLYVIGYYLSGSFFSLENGTDRTLGYYQWWVDLPEGPFIVEVFAQDAFGQNDSIYLTLYKDVDPPTIEINSPQSDDLFGENPPSVSLNVQDTNLEEVWYQLNNGTVITNNYSWTGSISEIVWNQVGNGTVTIIFYANDTATNKNSKEVTIRKDIYNPIIMIETPQDNDLFGIAPPNFAIYTSKTDVTTWYTLDDGQTNFTCGLTGTINQAAWDNFGYELVTIRFYINDSLGKIGTDEIVVRKDPNPPILIFNSPNNHTAFASAPFINLTIIDEYYVDNVWYKIGTTIVDITNNLNCYLNSSIWNTLSQGLFTLQFFANDTVGNINNFYKLELSKDTLGPNITLILPHQNQKVDRQAPYFELSIVDENGVGSCWYRLEDSRINNIFTGDIGRINQTLWENLWDSLAQGDEITIMFFSNDTLGNENYINVILIKEEALNFINFFTGPLGILVPIIGVGVMIPLTAILTNSRKYKSLDKKGKSKLNKFLFLLLFISSLTLVMYLF